MHRFKMSLLLTSLVALAPPLAFAQEPDDVPPPPPEAIEPAPAYPPPPPVEAPVPQRFAPAAQMPPPPVQVDPNAGQWVYTNQYGWIWIPHAREYTAIPNDPQAFPYQFVYYPTHGWRWVVAPWVYGYGPVPYWGPRGIRPFVWFNRPWFQVGGYWGWGNFHSWGPYRGWVGPRDWRHSGWRRTPGNFRGGPSVAPAPRQAVPGGRSGGPGDGRPSGSGRRSQGGGFRGHR